LRPSVDEATSVGTQVEGSLAKAQVTALGALSVLAFFATRHFVPIVKEYTLKADIFGRDINKHGTDRMCAVFSSSPSLWLCSSVGG
jgi:hypothetical protein